MLHQLILIALSADITVGTIGIILMQIRSTLITHGIPLIIHGAETTAGTAGILGTAGTTAMVALQAIMLIILLAYLLQAVLSVQIVT